MGALEIENTFLSQAVLLWFLLVWAPTAGACSAELSKAPGLAGADGVGCPVLEPPPQQHPEPFALHLLPLS